MLTRNHQPRWWCRELCFPFTLCMCTCVCEGYPQAFLPGAALAHPRMSATASALPYPRPYSAVFSAARGRHRSLLEGPARAWSSLVLVISLIPPREQPQEPKLSTRGRWPPGHKTPSKLQSWIHTPHRSLSVQALTLHIPGTEMCLFNPFLDPSGACIKFFPHACPWQSSLLRFSVSLLLMKATLQILDMCCP